MNDETLRGGVAWLRDLARDDIPLAGGKGANLGELTRARVRVPAGYVITTDAYRAAAAPLRDRLLDAAGREPDAAASEIAELFAQASVPDDVRDAVVAAYAELSDGSPDAVAVRSSATAEDLPDASFAGLQDTFLNVRGDADLLLAVRRCWASLWSARSPTGGGWGSTPPTWRSPSSSSDWWTPPPPASPSRPTPRRAAGTASPSTRPGAWVRPSSPGA